MLTLLITGMVAHIKPYIRSIGSECNILKVPTQKPQVPPTLPQHEDIVSDIESDDLQSDDDTLYFPDSSTGSSDIVVDEFEGYLSICILITRIHYFHLFNIQLTGNLRCDFNISL